MKPSFHPHLINGAGGDPALYVDVLFASRAMLFDLGDLAALAPRKALRLSDVFVSHAHVDHFIGFDQLLRLMVGRDKRLALYGPPNFIERVANRLGGYTWNLVENYQDDFVVTVLELHAEHARRARFRCRTAFRPEPLADVAVHDGVLLDEGNLRVRGALLDHQTPCVCYVLEERRHVNVWKNRLEARGLPTGRWLQRLKQAVLDDAADETVIALPGGHSARLGELKRELLRIVPGQKIGYVADALYSEPNAQRIVALMQGAEQLFIEAPFPDRDAARAAARHHLTARQAGELARRAGAKRCIPFHFSPRHAGEVQALRDEAEAAFAGGDESH